MLKETRVARSKAEASIAETGTCLSGLTWRRFCSRMTSWKNLGQRHTSFFEAIPNEGHDSAANLFSCRSRRTT
jgi:hypothetical protein